MLAVVFRYAENGLELREVTTRAELDSALAHGWHCPIIVVRDSRFSNAEIEDVRQADEQKWRRDAS